MNVRETFPSRPSRVTLICEYCNGVHNGYSELGGHLDARWMAERKIQDCGIKHGKLPKREEGT